MAREHNVAFHNVITVTLLSLSKSSDFTVALQLSKTSCGLTQINMHNQIESKIKSHECFIIKRKFAAVVLVPSCLIFINICVNRLNRI